VHHVIRYDSLPLRPAIELELDHIQVGRVGTLLGCSYDSLPLLDCLYVLGGMFRHLAWPISDVNFSVFFRIYLNVYPTKEQPRQPTPRQAQLRPHRPTRMVACTPLRDLSPSSVLPSSRLFTPSRETPQAAGPAGARVGENETLAPPVLPRRSGTHPSTSAAHPPVLAGRAAHRPPSISQRPSTHPPPAVKSLLPGASVPH
jgi:hypothetical protein